MQREAQAEATHESRAAGGRAARLWLGIFLPGYLVVALLCVLAITLIPIPYGDLTRLGRVSEHSFGWTIDQPVIPLEHRKNSPIQEADVLVIGDSFTMSITWQAVLEEAGLRVYSTHWDSVKGVCADFPQWLVDSGFKARFIVLESVERYLTQRLEQSASCTKMTAPGPLAGAWGLKERPPGFALNMDSKLATAYETLRRTRMVKQAKDSLVLENEPDDPSPVVAASKVPAGCLQFSHRFCESMLFLHDDNTTTELTRAQASTLKRIADSVHTAQVVWMVAPNKYTTYVNPRYSTPFVDAFNKLDLGPDLFAAAQTARWKIKDLYWPNDSHWSTAGQLYFGGQILSWLQQLDKRNAKKAPSRS